MTPAAAFEEFRRELARLGVAVVKDAIRRLVKLEQALEVVANPPWWIDADNVVSTEEIRGLEVTSLEIDGDKRPFADVDVGPLVTSKLNETLTAEGVSFDQAREDLLGMIPDDEARDPLDHADDPTGERCTYCGGPIVVGLDEDPDGNLVGDPHCRACGASAQELRAMVRDEQDTDDEEGRP